MKTLNSQVGSLMNKLIQIINKLLTSRFKKLKIINF